ncbi:MAG: hypothetical protein ACRDG7_08025 [Candidatus Limnocylindria bacterium]
MRIRLPFVVLALAVLLVAHQLVYLATYGWRGVERALSSVGHDGYWFVIGSAVSLVLLVGFAFSLRRWLTLCAELRQSGAGRRQGSIDWPVFRATVVRLVPRLALVALALFFAQENLEHYLHHAGHVPGLGVLLGPEYVATLPIFVAVAMVVALITALLRLGLAALARLVERTTRRRPARDVPRPVGRQLPVHPCSRTAPDLGRAPPALA